MITRIWHGITKAEDADSYLKYIEDTGIKDYKNIKGNLSAKILRRVENDIYPRPGLCSQPCAYAGHGRAELFTVNRVFALHSPDVIFCRTISVIHRIFYQSPHSTARIVVNII